ncbi:rho guanine nucleotide exchange factor 10 isoform X7 [Camelus ferus]|uniref:Rho guanine nucleotide exchange factor 10 n=1 Tax=Camelus ferus TaxID=419612 RepID=A0A8B8S3R6_CAMFR|nr:rho guanine nucleotide exchange factor 10 isoform X7 [Camelus ferus]
MRGRRGGARPRNGQARQPMGSGGRPIRPVTAWGWDGLLMGGAGAHPGGGRRAGRGALGGTAGGGPVPAAGVPAPPRPRSQVDGGDMDQPGPPAPAAEENEVKYDRNNNEEEEGERLDFNNGDEVPDTDGQAPGAPQAGDAGAAAPTPTTATDTVTATDTGPATDTTVTATATATTTDTTVTAATISTAGSGGENGRLGADAAAPAEPPKLMVPPRVNPYSVIDITPFQEDPPLPADADAQEEPAGLHVPSGYSVPVPCGYAVPSNLPLLLPAYCSPVVTPVDPTETQEAAEDNQFNSLSSEDPANSEDPAHREESALARWVADPDNTAWMENPEEAIYDDVPRENSDSEPDEMIYDDVEDGAEGGDSSLECGWSSSEFESYGEQSDCESRDGPPRPFLRGGHRKQVVRRYILGSVVDSEKNYVDALKRILEQYERPLSEMEPKMLSERKLRTVFYRVKEVLQCHCLFQMALASRVAEWDSVEMIGDVFVASFSKSMVLDAYSEYVNNFSTAVAILKKTCATKPAFLEFLKQCQESSPDRVTLYSLMMKPIQRFPQFILLLQDMLKNTSRGHPDRLPLQMALTELETLAEKLNERKRDADRRCEIRQIAKAANERYVSKLLSSGSRYLVRSDDMIETVYNDRGEVVKTKERRLFMLSDVLMCATVSTRTSHDSSALTSTSQRYLLKWSVPLGHVEVVEYGGSDGAGESSRCPLVHAPESLAVVASTKPSLCCFLSSCFADRVYMGPGQLYQDLQNLLHDLNVIGQITQLIGNLKGNYQNLNQSVAHDWTSGLQRLVLKKEEEIRAADCCRIQLQLPGKQDKSGRPTFFTAVFNTFTPAIKESWTHNLQMAKLALEEENHLGWLCTEDDGNQIKKERHPLLVGHMPVTVAKQQEFKIECAVYNPEPYLNDEARPDSCSTAHGFLWIGSCAAQMGQIAIVSFQSPSPKVIECFNVESRILCMAYVPAEEKPRGPGAPPEPEATAGHVLGVPTICLGTEEGSISVYKSSQGSKKVQLQHFFTPEKCAVLSLACSPRSLYAGLVSGAVAVYARAEDGSWNSEPQKVLKLGVLPVRSLLMMEDSLWAASGGQVFIISAGAQAVEGQLEAHQEEGMVVSHLAVAGVGIWVAFTSGSTLRLFHTETLKHLQDINIATPVHHMLPGPQRLSVTSLLVCHGLLMVGTSLGVVVALPVPRLQGIPKVTGRGMVSYHAHNGPVKFLVEATAALKTDKDKPRDSPPLSVDPQDEDQRDALPGEGPGPCPARSSPDAVWLGASLGSTTQASDVSSSSGSLTPSQGSGSLEPRSEEGFLQDLLRHPGISAGRGRRARKAKASSVLVACGGQGHRRMSRKARQQRPEELVSSVMVWQIPLLNV